jgi:hypothetical protein
MKKYTVRGMEYTSAELHWKLDQLEAAIMQNSFDTELDDEYQEFLDAYRAANQ